MPEVLVYERTTQTFAATLPDRGHHIVYRASASSHCPGCGRSNWYIGRITAECGFCGTAVPLAEASSTYSSTGARSAKRPSRTDQRLSPRKPAKGQSLQLLIDGSPTKFALHNISESGAMGVNPLDLRTGATVEVRLDNGVTVSAVVKWAEDGLVGLAFATPLKLDRSSLPTH